MEYVEGERFDCRAIESLVLDEADRMLDMGFGPAVERLSNECRWRKQSMLFSATLEGKGIQGFKETLLTDPVEVTAEPPRRERKKITQWYYRCDDMNHKYALLKSILADQANRAIIFVKTRERLAALREELTRQKISCAWIQGEMAQAKRTNAIERFSSGEINFLLATDVAARGIDVPNISHVINFDLPRKADVYLHRIGRTARAGNIAGVAAAIGFGGPGAIFWMWVVAFLGAATAYTESTLAQIYKEEDNGEFRGGPAYYIEKAMGQKWYAWIFAIATIFACGVLLPGVQSNSIATAFMILITGAYNVHGAGEAFIVQNIAADIAANGPVFTQMAIESTMPDWGKPFIAVALFFFAFTTILAYYYIAETNIAYIRRTFKVSGMMFVLKLVLMAAVFYGTVKTANLAWAMGDVGVGLMAWLNITGLLIIFFLGRPALVALRDYERQQKDGVEEYTFDPVKLGIKNADYWEQRLARRTHRAQESNVQEVSTKPVNPTA
eukprot:snap_masked-scaffold502_size153915-processed-gene-0.10 protein:Tk05904 transcript:snap_masked-scaffold502_size153915-processed-gene-0.10-mRNA-1 annotation:"rna helicase"